MNAFKKTQAKLRILHAVLGSHLLEFGTKQWTSANLDLRKVEKGDLVAMQSAPPSAHYLSWVIDTRLNNLMDIEFLLESVEDGSLCWWSNIGLTFFDRDHVMAHPEWKWVDRQFKLQSQWFRTASRNHYHGLVPVAPVFGDNFEVTIDVRVKFGWDDYKKPMKFDDYRKIKVREMTEHWLDCSKEYNQKLLKTRKENAEKI